jgi:hypothetical protein
MHKSTYAVERRTVAATAIVLLALTPCCFSMRLRGQVRATSTAPTQLLASYAMSNGNDASGNGRTATLTGTTTVPGKYAEGQRFTGVSGSRMTIPTFNVTTAFTLEAWVFLNQNTVSAVDATPTAVSGWQALIYKSHDAFFIAEVGGFVMAGFTPSGTGAKVVQILSPTKMLAGGFHHVASTYDGATFTLAIDGQQVASTKATGTVVQGTQAVEVGGSVDGGYVDGIIDDVRIYGRALSLSEIGSDLATPVDTVQDDVTNWVFEVFPPGTQSAPAGVGPLATMSVPRASAVCNLAPTTPAAMTPRNPTLARVTDPAVMGKECEFAIETFVLSLPTALGYVATASAVGSAGVPSARSPLSNVFDRVAVIQPPTPPAGTVIVK